MLCFPDTVGNRPDYKNHLAPALPGTHNPVEIETNRAPVTTDWTKTAMEEFRANGDTEKGLLTLTLGNWTKCPRGSCV